jgi:D-lactate dehydrogenase
MKALVFSSRSYSESALKAENVSGRHQLKFLETNLNAATAPLCSGYDAALIFVNDKVDRPCLQILAQGGTKLVATLSTGTNHIDLTAAKDLGITIASVPSYSPHAVSEFTLAVLLAMARKIHRASHRIREGNFELEGLEGFELREKTVGVFGTGAIGREVVKNLSGFGCKILAHDPSPDADTAKLCRYVPQGDLFRESDIITFHVPLLPSTRHLVNEQTLGLMKKGVFLINTSRGAIFDTPAIIHGLKKGHIGHLAIDVYEEEAGLFFEDRSSEILKDDIFARLLTFPNVLVTGHQAFLTDHALRSIAQTTLQSLTEFESSGKCTYCVRS